jgi:hypothetical protein
VDFFTLSLPKFIALNSDSNSLSSSELRNSDFINATSFTTPYDSTESLTVNFPFNNEFFFNASVYFKIGPLCRHRCELFQLSPRFRWRQLHSIADGLAWERTRIALNMRSIALR